MSKANIEHIEYIIQWYFYTSEWLQNFAGILYKFAREEKNTYELIPSDLIFLTPSEIEDSLNRKLDHLSTATSLKLFAAFEGSLRFDTKNRLNKRRIGKDLKNLIKKKKKNLKDIDIRDIIDCWCNRYSINKTTFSTLKGLFNYRHWLVHGRYWDDINCSIEKTAITPDLIYSKMRQCFDEFRQYEVDFEW